MSSITVDTTSLLSPSTGIGRYTYEIAKRIQKDSSFKSRFFYGYYSQTLIKSSQPTSTKTLKKIIDKSRILKAIARRVIRLYSRFYHPKCDIYWQPNFIPLPSIKAKKVVTTVHDFSFILHRDYHPKERIEHFENHFFQSINLSDLIITGSNYSKKEILDRLDFKEHQVKVIYHGLNHNLFRCYEDIKLDFDLPKKFILSVGSIEPRKNLLGLLKAYNLLDDKTKDEYKLVLVGFKGWQNRELMQEIEKNKTHIDYLGFISDEELAKVYNLATCFIFPSFYEGFGLPILEAMACATPVISSNTTSMPEVGGDAVLYCDPNNLEDIKENLHTLLHDEVLQKDMIEKGLKRVQNFTWENSAKEHIKVFKELLDEA